MQISFADNVTVKMSEVLAEKIPAANDLRFAVAFVSYSGLSLLRPLIEQSLNLGGQVEFLVGLDFLNTEANALRAIYGMTQAGSRVQCYCLSSLTTPTQAIYHPKLYIIISKNEATIAIGSSNLTMGGLRSNMEANAVFHTAPEDEVVSDAYALYNRLKFEQPHVPLDGELIEIYEALHKHSRKRVRVALRDAKTAELTKAFEDKLATLKHPQPTERDLYGWQKLVYERLPSGQFKTNYLYQCEREFQRYYPENRHIPDKIRQILQQLRSLGLLTHVATNLWEKKR